MASLDIIEEHLGIDFANVRLRNGRKKHNKNQYNTIFRIKLGVCWTSISGTIVMVTDYRLHELMESQKELEFIE